MREHRRSESGSDGTWFASARPPSAATHRVGGFQRVFHAPSHERSGDAQTLGAGDACCRACGECASDSAAATNEARDKAHGHGNHQTSSGKRAAEHAHHLIRPQNGIGVGEPLHHAEKEQRHGGGIGIALGVHRLRSDAEQLGGARRAEQRVHRNDDDEQGSCHENDRATARTPRNHAP